MAGDRCRAGPSVPSSHVCNPDTSNLRKDGELSSSRVLSCPIARVGAVDVWGSQLKGTLVGICKIPSACGMCPLSSLRAGTAVRSTARVLL